MKAKSDLIRILFADTDAVVCLAMRRSLQQFGNLIVTIAYDGGDLLYRLTRESFDIVLVGAILAGRDGINILRQVHEFDSAMPVILLGDHVTPGMVSQLTASGAILVFNASQEDTKELADAIVRAVEPIRARKKIGDIDEAPDWLRDANVPVLDEVRVPVTVVPESIEDDTEFKRAIRGLIASSSTMSFAEMSQLLLESSAELFNTARAALFRLQDKTVQLCCSLGFSDLTEAARDLMQSVGDSFAWQVVSKNETQTLFETMPDGKKIIRCIGVPVISHNQIWGALVVYDLPTQTIPTARIEWLELYAAQGGLAFHTESLRTENEHLTPDDPLTGVLKRNVFLDLADHEFRRSWRYNQPIAALIIDIDEMQMINARGGRELGDQVLYAVAKACRNIVRSIDLVGRYDDDSIAVLLLMTDRSGAKNAAERLRIGIASLKLPGDNPDWRVTATLGVAPYPRESCSSIYDLLNVAQQAQNAAHRSGRNQIMVV
jgi:diguanylate cyclase (GGDEF)-like protein